MKKIKRANNSGYSMMEMIIVLAIMAILSTLAIVTWNSVDSAKYRKAVSTLESEMTTLRTATMAQDSRMAMRLYLADDGKSYCIERGYCDSAGMFHALSYGDSMPTESGGYVLSELDYYKYTGTSNPIVLMDRGSINYEGASLNSYVDGDGVVVHFKKSDGSVTVTDKNGNPIATSSSVAGTFSVYNRAGKLKTNVHLKFTTGLYYESY